MIKIWVPIILGVLIFPIISTKMKELEDRLTKASGKGDSLNEQLAKKSLNKFKLASLLIFFLICLTTILFLRTIFTD